MTTLGGIHLLVETESPSFSVSIADHPVEKGENITDHVKKNSTKFGISGVVVGVDAESKKTQLLQFMNSGKPLFYNGRNKLTNVLIESFQPDYDSRIGNGFRFTMTLKEIRISSPAVIVTKAVKAQSKSVTNKGMQQVSSKQSEKWVTIRKGDTFWALSRTYGKNLDSVLKLNPGVDPRKLQIGQKVRIS